MRSLLPAGSRAQWMCVSSGGRQGACEKAKLRTRRTTATRAALPSRPMVLAAAAARELKLRWLTHGRCG